LLFVFFAWLAPSVTTLLHTSMVLGVFTEKMVLPHSPPPLIVQEQHAASPLSLSPFLLRHYDWFLIHHLSPSLHQKHTQRQVQQILAGIMDGTIALTAVQDDGTTFSVKDLICSVEVTLGFESPPMVPTLPPTVQPDLIPIVQIFLLLAGSPQQQDEVIASLIAYLIAHIQQMSGQNVVVMSPEAPEPINRHRFLRSVPAPGQLCTTDAPQNENSIDLRNYDDVVRTWQ